MSQKESKLEEDLQGQQRFYENTWEKGLAKGKKQRGDLQSNLSFLEKTGLLEKPCKILEIGCGIGSVVSRLSEQGHDAEGVDISETAIRYGREEYPGVKLNVQAAEKLPFADGSFDLVLSFDLFEHISEIDLHIEQVKRVLRNGGYYLFETPNKYSNALFETISSRSLRWKRFHPSLHSPGQLKKRLEKHGFGVSFVKISPVNDYNIIKVRRVFGGAAAKLFSSIGFRRLPLFMQTNLYVAARKEE
ncbi:putative S-adenosylmethionine-dependent methyltransferase/MSMEI_2290 [Anaerohalosphaera lusitana]|uniref:Putative S-adenosylmethionine-dependent methyltransferase/MSMEI_2290 n=1 Tax=Anaerohalosphaera lusitana TaxID=1936003 RepID=A0A1U9NPU9_9BACT|nr:class I SAM-dependent methyltransferase [Anaerohalosphaera lusitana]AQT69630.1 putative S-adenosylmethionine-dependent methyltransferase/MSMEI_2290 [Anaerohalosphaera lusitana]